MTELVHAALRIRRSIRAAYGFLAAAVFATLLLLGVFADGGYWLLHAILGASWLGVTATRATHYSRSGERSSPLYVDLELGLLVLIAVHALLQLTGGSESALHPLIYVVVAAIASFARAPMGHAVVALAIVIQAGIYFVLEGGRDIRAFALEAAFLAGFGVLHLLVTRLEVVRVREQSQRERDEERSRLKDESRMFRLVAPTREKADEERLARSSLEAVHHQLYFVLEMLKRTLGLHTAVLLLREEGDEEGARVKGRLRIGELASDSEDIVSTPFGAGEGAVGAVVKRQLPMNLQNLKAGYKGLPYYSLPTGVSDFCGVPIVDDGEVRGVLCADRMGNRPFTKDEEALLVSSIDQVRRTLENERVFIQLERSKREQTILYEASQSLGAALSESDVLDAAFAAAHAITPYDFAAFTDYDSHEGRHTVRRAQGIGSEAVRKVSFRDNTSLTAMAIKNRHYLPYRGEFDSKQQVVFTRRNNLEEMRSLLILPLIVREDPIGALVLAAKRPGAFKAGARTTLEALANQMAVAIANADAVKRLENMATTDGLTGCLNKRAFLEEMDKKLRAAERFGRPLSLLVTDIDHFKSVNDTYGHATGDVVIKELGAILQRAKRETDIVARFGGEEFCVLCEETDSEGATLLAERIREEVQATVFRTELGELRVTTSIGVATFPQHAEDSAGLFETTDKALYAAKHGGRNQVQVAGR